VSEAGARAPREEAARWPEQAAVSACRQYTGLVNPTLHAPGAVLLVACYELGHQPLTVAWAAAALEASGFQPSIMDVSVEPFDDDKAQRAQLAVIAVPMHTALRVGTTVASRIRALNPSGHICFMGLYASLNADHLLAHGGDSVIGGEGEAALVALAEALARGDSAPVPGVSRPGQPAPPNLVKLRLPVPNRAQLPSIKRYAQLEHRGRRALAGYVEASRGCLHRCRHCPIPPVYDGRFFVTPREVVLADIRQQVEAGAGHITFGDPDFLNGPGHALAVARGLHAEFPELTFDFTAKIEHLRSRRELLPLFAELGCLFIVSAAESLSDVVLTHLDKGHTRADIAAALAAARAAGIALRPTWVPFTPWTTLDDYAELLDFVAEEGLIDHVDPVQYALRLLVPPGSLLAGSAAMRPHLGDLVPEDFAYRWRHPDARMDELQAAVAQAGAQAAERGEDPAVTFDRVRALADAAGDGRWPRVAEAPRLAHDRPRPPYLTEPWFC
jgi:radical SAM superfamily enzyme YgiQ (UPF0313 family)